MVLTAYTIFFMLVSDRTWGIEHSGCDLFRTTRKSCPGGFLSDNQCISAESWCAIDPGGQRPRGFASEHLKFSFCSTYKKRLNFSDGTYEYLLTGVKTSWKIAKEYCQHLGYNLMYFNDQIEVYNVSKFIRTSANISQLKRQRCPGHMNPRASFWLDVTFDNVRNYWVSGEKAANLSIQITNKLSTVIGLNSLVERADLRFAFDTSDYRPFLVGAIYQNYPNVLCKRRVTQCGRPMRGIGSCITGFSCDAGRKCLYGLEFGPKSDVLDGRVDCTDGSDESIRALAPHIQRRAIDGTEYLFIPTSKHFSLLEEVCYKMNSTIPTVLEEQDLIDVRQAQASFLAKSPALPTNAAVIFRAFGTGVGNKTLKGLLSTTHDGATSEIDTSQAYVVLCEKKKVEPKACEGSSAPPTCFVLPVILTGSWYNYW